MDLNLICEHCRIADQYRNIHHFLTNLATFLANVSETARNISYTRTRNRAAIMARTLASERTVSWTALTTVIFIFTGKYNILPYCDTHLRKRILHTHSVPDDYVNQPNIALYPRHQQRESNTSRYIQIIQFIPFCIMQFIRVV